MFPPNRDYLRVWRGHWDMLGGLEHLVSGRRWWWVRGAEGTAWGRGGGSEDFKAPMGAAGGPRRAGTARGGMARRGSAPSQGIRGLRSWMDPSSKRRPL